MMAPRKAKTIRRLTDLTPDQQNPNRGTERGVYAVETSLERYGAGRSILVDARGRVIAGNKTLQAAADKGFGVDVIQTTGDRLVVVQRTDLDLDDPAGAARALSVADNRAGELGLDWDPVAMSAHMAAGMDVGAFFREGEMSALLASVEAPIDRAGKKSGASPWDRMNGKAKDGVLVQIGAICAKISQPAYDHFFANLPLEGVAEHIEGLLTQ